MNPFLVEELGRPPFDLLMQSIELDDSCSEVVRDLMEKTEKGERERLFAGLERAREQHRLPAASVYENVIRRPPDRDAFERSLALVVEDGGWASILLLAYLMETSADVALRTRMGIAALEMDRKALTSQGRPLEGRAWMTPCDGRGLSSVMLHVVDDAGIARQGLVFMDVQRGLLDGARRGGTEGDAQVALNEAMEALNGTPVVEIDLALAADLVDRCCRESMGRARRCPSRAFPVVSLVKEQSLGSLPKPRPSASLPSKEQLRGLVGSQAPIPPWAFHVEEVEMLAAASFDPRKGFSRKVESLAKRIVSHQGMVHRLRAMCAHQATWHHLRGEDQEAARLAALAEAREDDRFLPLIEVMVEGIQDRVPPKGANTEGISP